MINKICHSRPVLWNAALIFLAACTLAACQKTTTANPATATARSRRVIAQATDVALQLRESIILDEKQATATAQAQVDRLAQASEWPEVLADTFDGNTNEWVVGQKTGEYADATFTIADGVYHWEAISHKGFVWWNVPTIASVSDFYLAVDYRPISGPAEAYAGLVMRLDKDGDYYLFSLRNTGEYSLDVYYNSTWLSLIGWTPSPAIRVDETNHVEVVGEGQRFAMFVNGEWVADYEDATIPSGYSGLLIGMDQTGESTAWDFDNFELRGITVAQEALPPDATATP
jgi:hypothetical protein